MNIILPSAYNNESAHQLVKQLMEQKRNMSIRLDNEPNAWISTPKITGLRYQLNEESWKWLINYLSTGESDDFGVFPSQLKLLPDFQLTVLEELIDKKYRVQRVPFLRETFPYINLIASFKYGKIYFRINRSDIFMNYLNSHSICQL